MIDVTELDYRHASRSVAAAPMPPLITRRLPRKTRHAPMPFCR